MVTAGILPFRKNSHGRTGNRTRDLMISRQKLWLLDHEAGQLQNVSLQLLNDRYSGPTNICRVTLDMYDETQVGPLDLTENYKLVGKLQ